MDRYVEEASYQIVKESITEFNNVFNKDDFFIPFFSYFVSTFEKRVTEALNKLPDDKVQKESLLASLLVNYKRKIVNVMSKMVIYEFHNTFEKYDPSDDTKYYKAFNNLLGDPNNIEAILEKYPVLVEMIASIEDNFLHNHIKIIQRYQNDHTYIEKKLRITLGDLLKVSIDMGDTHRDGNSVAILECEENTLVYKPRSLTVDCLYEDIIIFFNETCQTNLKTMRTCDRGDYGWQEYIEPLPLKEKQEAEVFYKELGMHLGFIYMFQGSDFHYENIMAHGSKPVLIDLETLFQPNLYFNGVDEIEKPKQFLDNLNQTVYKSLFLNHTTYPEETKIMHLYALSNVENQSYDEEQVMYKGTDHLALQKVPTLMTRGDNLPVYQNEIIEIFGYEKEFIKGFEHVYAFFRENYLSISKIINQFPDFPVRIVTRPTYIYTSFLKSLLHPKYLGEFSERERVLSFFNDSYEDFQSFRAIVPYEKCDLYKGDVPYFYANFNETKLYNSQDEVVNCQIVKNSPKQEVESRMANLSTEDLDFQVKLINMSLSASLANGNSTVAANTKGVYRQGLEIKNIDDLLQKETTTLFNERLEYGNNVQWLSLSISTTGQMVAGPLSFGLYDGLAGIILYLATYSHFCESDTIPYEKLQHLHHSVSNLLESSELKGNFSAYYGLGSYIYYIEKLRQLTILTKENAIKQYETFCRQLIGNLDNIHATDFIGGLAGILKLLSLLYKTHKAPFLKEAAYQVYRSLLSRVKRENDEMYWEADAFKNTVLTGFSHGLTGICYALSEFSMIASTETKTDIANVITKALRYEDKFFDHDKRDWKDNRQNNMTFSSPFWCHGATGILLGRLKIKQNMGTMCSVNYINDALSTTLKYGDDHTQGNSLCHGTLGNLDSLLAIKDAPFLAERKEEIEQTINKWLTHYREEMITSGWNNGVKNDFSSVGFMLGRTGQLYTLLRAQNNHIPSVLLLD
ncbi:type 2 lantipeptide synthetase LanM [Salipaludibacillus agaradhaerens]|uniref:Type 2 lantipeptide synthetase LanM n=1 Tax=Salipaludibacillus agaradhaerens TaxID=76935 RepID=A0A9Q4FZN9_SALAG|nr:type 2 lanthipeptide synthetase LanM family protein [Salipaludibacillus agaradhaerens]MCR6097292.1 type 2 lantipeptide synthetase LanM [Salipaludibacillus agaradhaerens]MCR6113223.1 type 2 lantipeptide synthetase LanM [Salipaludibacillus agaradhaerens]